MALAMERAGGEHGLDRCGQRGIRQRAHRSTPSRCRGRRRAMAVNARARCARHGRPPPAHRVCRLPAKPPCSWPESPSRQRVVWSCPVLVDTGYGLRGRCELLFLHWRHVADCRVQAMAIVEPFDELEEPTSRCLARLVAGCVIERRAWALSLAALSRSGTPSCGTGATTAEPSFADNGGSKSVRHSQMGASQWEIHSVKSTSFANRSRR